MRLVDANVLLYAVNADAEHHDAARDWLDRALAGEDSVGFAWLPLLAFVRLATKENLFPDPLSPVEAGDQVGEWLAAPGAHVVHPGSSHARTLTDLLVAVGAGGNLVNGAHLAAIALEQRADVVSYDSDLGRFHGVRWYRPDDLV